MPNTPLADDRAAQLFAEGARLLESHWDESVSMVRLPEHPSYHDARGTLTYAIVLLRQGDGARADRAIRAVLALQELREQDAHYGNFRWTLEEEVVSDLNGVEFVLEGLNYLLRFHSEGLSPDLARDVREALALGLDEIDRLDVQPSYTNIALSDICNSILGGETLGVPYYVERGARRLDEWLEFTNRSGAPHEFNSPTYIGVDIQRLAFLAEQASEPEISLRARIAEERLWLHVAAHYHPRLAQLAGPHSRSYFDGWSGAGGYLKLILWRILGDDNLRRPTPYVLRTREEAEVEVALDVYHCPDYIIEMLRARPFPFDAREITDAANGLDITTYMTDSYALGTASHAYGVGDPPEPWPAFNSLLLHFRRDAAPGYGTLFVRFLVGDGRSRRQSAEGPAEDLWDEGQFVAAQHRNRAILAYGLRPRMRPATSYRLSLRMLGIAPDAEIWAGDRRLDSLPAPIEPGEPLVIAAGEVYVAIISLEPSAMGNGVTVTLSISEGVLTLDIYNYAGPAKSFWEHRSQSGPFYQGNVRNAVVLEVAERTEFPDLRAFRTHITAAHVADSSGPGHEREIAYSSRGGSLSLRYDRADMRLIERRHDGVVYAPPMASARQATAIPPGRDGGAAADEPAGAQWVQSREPIIELADARLFAGTTPKWFFADPARGRYAFVNPGSDEAPVWLETPDTVIECDAFSFGRVDLDEQAAVVRIEAVGEIGAVRLRSVAGLRLHLNGVDVTDAMTQLDDSVREFAGL